MIRHQVPFLNATFLLKRQLAKHLSKVVLETLAIKGALVRIDAMGCQRQIAAASGNRGAHELRTVKNKQRALRSAIEAAFVDVPVAGFEHTERSHGRIVIEPVQVIENRGQVAASAWDGCQRLGRVVSLRVQPGKRQVTTAPSPGR